MINGKKMLVFRLVDLVLNSEQNSDLSLAENVGFGPCSVTNGFCMRKLLIDGRILATKT